MPYLKVTNCHVSPRHCFLGLQFDPLRVLGQSLHGIGGGDPIRHDHIVVGDRPLVPSHVLKSSAEGGPEMRRGHGLFCRV